MNVLALILENIPLWHMADIFMDYTFTCEHTKGSKTLTRHYDKQDDFDFHIVNFPFLSNTLSGPSYGVYILQFI